MWRFFFVLLFTAIAGAFVPQARASIQNAGHESAEVTWAFDKREDRNGNPRTNVFLVVGGRRVLVRRNVLAQYTEIAPEDYRSHGVPSAAVAACQGWWAGAGEDLYVIRRGRRLIVFIRYLDEQAAPGRFRRLKVISS